MKRNTGQNSGSLKNQYTKELTVDGKSVGKSRLRENIEAIVIAIVLALIIRSFIVQAFKIPSGSMKPTLQIGDHILVNKFIYGVKFPFSNTSIIPGTRPDRQDIVVFKYPRDPSKDYIKRVIAIEGDVVEVMNKKVFINNKPIEDPHASFTDPTYIPGPRDNYGPVRVPENSIFVMGDNRDHSFDSRFWGFVDISALRGKAFIVYFSWDKQSWTDIKIRWARFGHILR